MERLEIVIVDDHKIIRDGIKAMLLCNRDFTVVGEASNGSELKQILKVKNPHIVLMDISLPDETGIELTSFINKNYPAIKVLILTGNLDESIISQSVEAGSCGFLYKDCSQNDLLDALQMIASGEGYFGQRISGVVYQSYLKAIKNNTLNSCKVDVLSARELEVVKYFSDGLSFKEIASQLDISPRTVEAHKNNILNKLNIRTTVDLVKFAIREGIIKL